MGNMKIPILFEDNHIIVAEKPVNIPSQKDESDDDDILTLLKKDIKKRFNKPGNVFLGLVHRLDRPAGGAMIFARTSKAASRLSQQIRAGNFKKTYYAVVHGRPEKSGHLDHYLVKDGKSNTVHVSGKSAKGAKKSLLKYEVLENSGGLSLLKIDLATGRPHQIRVQLAATGHPLYGDQKYGPDINKPGMQLALWSAEISITHPVTNEIITFKSMPPAKAPWNFFNLFVK
jgi:23S rRNA pseudouridine1911/1915/1917 synthase